MLKAADALKNNKHNQCCRWNKSASTSILSVNENDASNRIFQEYAQVRPNFTGQRLTASAKVFAIGSCFAREIEWALMKRGGHIISIDDRIDIPAFHDSEGKARKTFFHRYTPTSMLQEFEWAFGACDTWSDDALIYQVGDRFMDLNYPDIGAPGTLDAVRTRRQVASELTRQVRDADIVIITLGLTEGWVHTPTGLAVNAVNGKVLAQHSNDFALTSITFEQTMTALERMIKLIRSVNPSDTLQFFVTVSPVPLQTTFFVKDIVVANMDSKATLRAAAKEFVERHQDVHYFPSYELVVYTEPSYAWRPDKVHINPEMVERIMASFIDNVYAPGVLA